MKKLCLGTVQFGIPYGINNSSGIPSLVEIREIFNVANRAEITFLDTAHVYGDAETKIGEHGEQKFNIVTKFSKLRTKEELEVELATSLSQLKTNSIYGYLAHSAETLIANPDIWEVLEKAKEKKTIKKIGYSLYSPKQLEKLLALNLIPDLVQLPYSLLDRKFETFLPQLKKLGTEIHVRSVFLQGLYFMNPLDLPIKLRSLKPHLHDLHKCSQEYNIDLGSLALNFAISNPCIDKVVVGVDNALQLQINIAAIQSWQYNQQLMDCVNKIVVINKELLNPANW